MKRRYTSRRKSIAVHLPLPIRRIRKHSPGGAARGSRRLRSNPTRLVRRAEARVVIQSLNLPDAAVLPITDLINALSPQGVTAVAADHRQRAPAALRRAATGPEMNHRLNVHVVVQPSRPQAELAHLDGADVQIQVSTNAFPADKHPGRIVGHRIIRKENGQVLPHALVEVIAVGTLQLLDRQQVFGGSYPGLQPLEALLQFRRNRGGSSSHFHDAEQGRGRAKRRHGRRKSKSHESPSLLSANDPSSPTSGR